jgi:excisionase family DNA binding protein
VRRGPLNPRRAKLHWSYTVAEAAKLFGVCRNTVRNWIANGLPVVKTSSGHLILGRELRAFLERERAKRKRKCPRGFLFCVGCREPRRPAGGQIAAAQATPTTVNMRASCEACGSLMHLRASRSKLSERGFAALLPQQGDSHLADSPDPSVHCDPQGPRQTHD